MAATCPGLDGPFLSFGARLESERESVSKERELDLDEARSDPLLLDPTRASSSLRLVSRALEPATLSLEEERRSARSRARSES